MLLYVLLCTSQLLQLSTAAVASAPERELQRDEVFENQPIPVPKRGESDNEGLEAPAEGFQLRERGPGNQKTKKTNPDRYLEKFGYLRRPDAGQDEIQHSPESRKEAIRNFQRMAGMKVTGKLDKKTVAKMAAPRCGMPDMIPEGTDMDGGSPSGVIAPQDYYVPGYKWTKTTLTWKILANGYSRQLSQSAQRRAIIRAFRHWSDVTPLKFQESSGNNVDIEIRFAPGDHGDGYSFDGRGGTLAHAFYPENGDTHFDESEKWVDRSSDGTDLEIVATHEFGHALGLGHSNVQQALMAPFYQGYDPNFKLSRDDIAGIQSLYGSSMRPTSRPTSAPRPTSKPRPTAPKPTKKPGEKPDMCEGKFDDVYQGTDGYIYAFVSKWVWKLNYWESEEDLKSVRKVFPTNPTPYYTRAAVYSWRTRYTYYFKGKKIYKYYGDRRVQKKTVRTQGYPYPQAALMPSDGRLYLIAGSFYWVFDESRLDIVPGSKGRVSDKWPGVPSGITAACRLSDGYLYFFKGAKYRKFHERTNRVVKGPKLTAPSWIGPKCSKSGRYDPK